jgi:hypothetical protein
VEFDRDTGNGGGYSHILQFPLPVTISPNFQARLTLSSGPVRAKPCEARVLKESVSLRS